MLLRNEGSQTREPSLMSEPVRDSIKSWKIISVRRRPNSLGGRRCGRASRGRYDRSRLRYPNDPGHGRGIGTLWRAIPPANAAVIGVMSSVREVVDGLMVSPLTPGNVTDGDRQDLAALDALHYFDLWGWDGTLDRPRRALCAVPPSRLAQPPRPPRSSTARASESAEKRGPAIDPTGYDAGKRCKSTEAPHPPSIRSC